MLEVINVTKIYEQKFGPRVRALDNVTLRFPDRGMVFLLGKSGSGKSTLLNVCGGLDAPTSGEIIVKGRSSKDFSQSDFDSYRNTYVGFVFQEYNILNEFTVEENISLALELQGKPRDKAAVEALLQQVDMLGYAKRKPNTLSGGQKQRIAIARALVKKPEIIMADEPTGALDSATGRQVFETLKNLSRDKLVIVVSHDRDFAERYGDRIIELEDGHILSDVTKVHQPQETLSDKISVVGDMLCVRQSGYLTDADFDQIKSFLLRENRDVLIAGGEQDVQTVKKATRITDDGQREVFRQTPPPQVWGYQGAIAKFIRSRLPLRHAARIGVSSMKTKPVRLIFTVLLCTIAFIMFGLLSTMSLYDSETTFKQSLMDSDLQLLRVEKNYQTHVTWYENGEAWDTYTQLDTTRFSEAELQKLMQTHGADVFGGVEVYSKINLRAQTSDYWLSMIRTMACLPENHSLRSQIKGSYPVADDEICISSYTADVIYNCGITDQSGKAIELKKAEDVIGKSIYIDSTLYKVVGIFDSGEVPAKYDSLLEGVDINWQLYYQYETEMGDGLHLTAFVNEASLKDLSDEYTYYYDSSLWNRWIYVDHDGGTGAGYQLPEYSNYVYSGLSGIPGGAVVQSLAEGEGAVIPVYYLYEMAYEHYSVRLEQSPEDEELRKLVNSCQTLVNDGYWTGENPYAEEETLLLAALERDGVQFKITMMLSNEGDMTTIGEAKEVPVVGFWSPQSANTDTTVIYLPDEMADAMWQEQKDGLLWYEEYTTNYVESPDALYSVIYLPYDHSTEQTEQFWSMYEDKTYAADDSRIRLSSSFIDNLEMIDEAIVMLEKVFLYVGLVLAVFAALLLSNFISVSIANKKREIGILRAVGARGTDVFKIFFSESFVIALICVVLSSLASVALCGAINGLLAESIGASLFVFGIGSFALVVGIAVVTAVVATFLPVWNAARKKPVDSIRAL